MSLGLRKGVTPTRNSNGTGQTVPKHSLTSAFDVFYLNKHNSLFYYPQFRYSS